MLEQDDLCPFDTAPSVGVRTIPRALKYNHSEKNGSSVARAGRQYHLNPAYFRGREQGAAGRNHSSNSAIAAFMNPRLPIYLRAVCLLV